MDSSWHLDWVVAAGVEEVDLCLCLFLIFWLQRKEQIIQQSHLLKACELEAVLCWAALVSVPLAKVLWHVVGAVFVLAESRTCCQSRPSAVDAFGAETQLVCQEEDLV